MDDIYTARQAIEFVKISMICGINLDAAVDDMLIRCDVMSVFRSDDGIPEMPVYLARYAHDSTLFSIASDLVRDYVKEKINKQETDIVH